MKIVKDEAIKIKKEQRILFDISIFYSWSGAKTPVLGFKVGFS